jgi:hypothetical protein
MGHRFATGRGDEPGLTLAYMAKPSIGFELSAKFSAVLPRVSKSSTVNAIEFVMVRPTFPARLNGRRTCLPTPYELRSAAQMLWVGGNNLSKD